MKVLKKIEGIDVKIKQEQVQNLPADMTTITDILDLRGSCFVLAKTNEQSIPATTSTRIEFNSLPQNDNNIVQLNGDGSFKVLKDITRLLITVNIRTSGSNGCIVYVVGDNSGFNVIAEPTNNNFLNGAGIIDVHKNGTYQLRIYSYSGSLKISGYDRTWVGINGVVLK